MAENRKRQQPASPASRKAQRREAESIWAALHARHCVYCHEWVSDTLFARCAEAIKRRGDGGAIIDTLPSSMRDRVRAARWSARCRGPPHNAHWPERIDKFSFSHSRWKLVCWRCDKRWIADSNVGDENTGPLVLRFYFSADPVLDPADDVLLDIDSDGEVSFTEFVNGVKDAIAASNNTHNKSSPELSAVLKILTDYVSSRGISLAQAFDDTVMPFESIGEHEILDGDDRVRKKLARVTTVFSAADYCGHLGNLGAVLLVAWDKACAVAYAARSDPKDFAAPPPLSLIHI